MGFYNSPKPAFFSFFCSFLIQRSNIMNWSTWMCHKLRALPNPTELSSLFIHPALVLYPILKQGCISNVTHFNCNCSVQSSSLTRPDCTISLAAEITIFFKRGSIIKSAIAACAPQSKSWKPRTELCCLDRWFRLNEARRLKETGG